MAKTQPNQPESGDNAIQRAAMYMAMVVRNALEDFHCKYLSDEQMKELNPLVRDAIYSALYAYVHAGTSLIAEQFVQYHMDSIPSYWEPPRINPSLKTELKRAAPRHDPV